VLNRALEATKELSGLPSEVDIGIWSCTNNARSNLRAIAAMKNPNDLTTELAQVLPESHDYVSDEFSPVKLAFLALQAVQQNPQPNENDIQMATEDLCIATTSFIVGLSSDMAWGRIKPKQEEIEHVSALLRLVHKAVEHDSRLHGSMGDRIASLLQASDSQPAGV